MQASDSASEIWETQAAIDACLLKAGVSATKMARWRQDGLLPDVVQVPTAYHGSTVHFPPGTCAQIEAAARLFKKKSLASWVGWQLWWVEYPVDERYWRAPLIESARRYEKAILRLINYMDRSENVTDKPTLQEKFAKSRASSFLLSRIRKRLWGEGLAAHVGIILSVATNDFVGFSLPGPKEEKAFDQERTIEAFDFSASQSDEILEHKLNLVGTLPDVLANISLAIKPGVLLEIAQGPEISIFAARDDVRNAYRIAVSLYDALGWIYGPEAFGLRFVAWIARRHSRWLDHIAILGIAALRRTTDDFYSSARIQEMADQAEKVRQDSLAIKALWKNDPRFREIFSPKRIRRAFQDDPSLQNFQREIIQARDDV